METKECVGTALGGLIPEWALQFKGACGCKDMELQMNKWGIDGCIERKNMIAGHLVAQSHHLVPAFKFVPDSVKRVVAFGLLKKAINAVQKDLAAQTVKEDARGR